MVTNLFCNGGVQNKFVYQPACSTLKKEQATEYIIERKSKGLFKRLFKRLSLSMKRFGYKVGIKFLNGSLVLENNNYLIKFVNIYFVFGLDS